MTMNELIGTDILEGMIITNKKLLSIPGIGSARFIRGYMLICAYGNDYGFLKELPKYDDVAWSLRYGCRCCVWDTLFNREVFIEWDDSNIDSMDGIFLRKTTATIDALVEDDNRYFDLIMEYSGNISCTIY